MGTKLYSKMSGYIKEMDNYKAFLKELKSILLYHDFLLSGGIHSL